MRDALADDVGLARGGAAVGLLLRKRAAGVVGTAELARVLLGRGLLAEAAVGVAAAHQQLRVFLIQPAPLGLHIGADRAADVRALVVVEPALGQGLVDHVHRALDETALVGVLDAQDELALSVAGNKIGIECGAQVAHVHVSCGGRRKTGAHLAGGDAGLRTSLYLSCCSSI